MGLANCKECGKLFVQVSRDICDECYKEEEDLVVAVQKYIKEHPKAPVEDICDALDVDEALILKFIRNKRLVIKLPNGTPLLTCKACGRGITSGTFCTVCKEQLGQGLDSAPSSAGDASSSGSGKRMTYGGRADESDSMIKNRFKRK